MKVKVDLKVCGVCGDKALGCNFNAVTCESCKAFFRRNALGQKQFKCPFSNNCEINTVTRRFCQKCRLDKCFSIGMCKDLIMSDEDKNLKRQKIEENRARKRDRVYGFKSGFKKIKRDDDYEDKYLSNVEVSSSDDVTEKTIINSVTESSLMGIIDSNEANCNNNMNGINEQPPPPTLDVTRDVVEDVHR